MRPQTLVNLTPFCLSGDYTTRHHQPAPKMWSEDLIQIAWAFQPVNLTYLHTSPPFIVLTREPTKPWLRRHTYTAHNLHRDSRVLDWLVELNLDGAQNGQRVGKPLARRWNWTTYARNMHGEFRIFYVPEKTNCSEYYTEQTCVPLGLQCECRRDSKEHLLDAKYAQPFKSRRLWQTHHCLIALKLKCAPSSCECCEPVCIQHRRTTTILLCNLLLRAIAHGTFGWATAAVVVAAAAVTLTQNAREHARATWIADGNIVA